MRVSKERLRRVLAEHCVRNRLPEMHMVRSRPWLLEHLAEILRRGSRDRTSPRYWAEHVAYCITTTFNRMGYQVLQEPEEGKVCVKMFSRRGINTWVCIPKDVAEKILVFGAVPDLKAS